MRHQSHLVARWLEGLDNMLQPLAALQTGGQAMGL
jgi:hypothetical protein